MAFCGSFHVEGELREVLHVMPSSKGRRVRNTENICSTSNYLVDTQLTLRVAPAHDDGCYEDCLPASRCGARLPDGHRRTPAPRLRRLPQRCVLLYWQSHSITQCRCKRSRRLPLRHPRAQKAFLASLPTLYSQRTVV